MRRTLLDELNTLKMRQALVLITLLLLPCAAWGGGIFTDFKGYDKVNSSIIFGSSTTGRWEILEVKGECYTYNTNQGLGITPESGEARLKLKSCFKVTGTIPSNGQMPSYATISATNTGNNGMYSLSFQKGDGPAISQNMNSGSSQNLPTGGSEIVFNNEYIILEFTANNSTDFYLQSILLNENLTIQGYDLWIGGARFTSDNLSSIASERPDSISGSITFDPDNSILTLENANIHRGITSGLSNLTIKLVGTNTVNSDAENGNSGDRYAIYSDNHDATLTVVRNEANANSELNLYANYTYSIIGGFASVSYGEGGYQTYLSSPSIPARYDTSSKDTKAYGKIGEYITNASITSAVTYPIWVSGNQITHANLGSATDNHYTFIEDENTLQLSGINIGPTDGYAICSNDESLKVKLVGTNSIQITYPFYSFYDGDATISFTTDTSNPGSLSLPRYSENSTYDVITGFKNSANPTVENGLVWQPTNSGEHVVSATISTLSYGLTVAGIAVTSVNCEDILDGDNKGKVSFTPAGDTQDATLYLTNANITGNIEWDMDDALTIQLTGGNTIDGYISSNQVVGLSITDPSGSDNSYLTVGKSDNTISAIRGFTGVTLASRLNYEENAIYNANSKELQISKATQGIPLVHISYHYGIFVGGVSVTNLNREDIQKDGSRKVSFTPADDNSPATLSLNNANVGEIVSGLSSLTIHVIGENVTKYIQTDPSATAGTLTLEKEDANSLLKFDPAGVSIDSFIFGFTSFTNNDFTLFGFDSDFNPLSGGFSYTESIKSLGWSGSDKPSKMVACVFFEGDGTADSPYLIQTKEDLARLSSFCSQGLITHGSVYQLSTDINCNGLVFEPIGVGESGINGFTGIFDGNSKTISNLTINTNSAAAGLFAKLGEGQQDGIIKNLKLSNCSFIGPDDVGAVVGYFHKGTIKNCEISSCTIQCGNAQSPRVGGIAGQVLSGTNSISGCKVSNTTITASTTYTSGEGTVSVGGIAGYVYSGCEVTECEATSVTINAHHSNGTCKAGGIAGFFEGSNLKDNTVNGTTSISTTDAAANFTAGAIVGEISTEISTDATMANNIYYYAVTITSGKGTSDENTKSGYLPHRGTNSDVDPEGVMMYTKNVIIPILNDAGSVRLDADYYYKVTSDNNNTTYSVAPGAEVLVIAESAVIEGSYTIDGKTETIALTPKEDSSYGYTFDMPDADVTFTIQKAAWVEMFEEQTYATYYNPNEDMAVPMGMTAYIVTGISEDGTKVTVSPVSYIKAGVAVLVEKGEIGEISETTDFSGSKMAYSDPDTPAKPSATDKWYVIYNNKFVKVTTGTEVSGGKCYLNLNGTSSSGTRSYYDIDGSDGTTALREVKSEGVKGEKWNDSEWFTLQGRRLSAKPTKSGLYLHNGIKVVIK